MSNNFHGIQTEGKKIYQNEIENQNPHHEKKGKQEKDKQENKTREKVEQEKSSERKWR